MRQIILGAAALCLCACGQQTQTASAPSGAGCARTAAHDVSWTDPHGADTVTTRADGPSCLQAAVSLVVRDARGDPLWTFISTYYDMTTGGVAPRDAPAVSPEQTDRFLASWANVTTQSSAQLPQWPERAPAIASPGGLIYSTALSREAYEAIRQRNLRMICYAAAVDATQCLVIDHASNAPTMIAAYGP